MCIYFLLLPSKLPHILQIKITHIITQFLWVNVQAGLAGCSALGLPKYRLGLSTNQRLNWGRTCFYAPLGCWHHLFPCSCRIMAAFFLNAGKEVLDLCRSLGRLSFLPTGLGKLRTKGGRCSTTCHHEGMTCLKTAESHRGRSRTLRTSFEHPDQAVPEADVCHPFSGAGRFPLMAYTNSNSFG